MKCKYFETSAKANMGVSETFLEIISELTEDHLIKRREENEE